MKEFVVNVKGLEIKVFQKDDGKFIIPNFVKELKKQGTCLKPAYEPIVVARKPTDGSLVDNIIEYGVGGLNIDECRVETADTLVHGGVLRTNSGDERSGKALGMFQDGTENTFVQNPNGRFPANIITDGSDEVAEGFPETKGGTAVRHNSGGFTFGGENKKPPMEDLGYDDDGSAMRYFYVAKESNKDKDNVSQTVGRFPANVITDGSDEVAEGFPNTKSNGGSGEASIINNFKNVYGEYKNGIIPSHLGGLGDEGSAMRYFYVAKEGEKDNDDIPQTVGRFPSNVILDGSEEVTSGFPVRETQNGSITKRYKMNNQVYGEYGYCNTWDGSASRYYYCAKASKKDRDEGVPKRNTHPTVKPTELMQYLVRLVSPKGATILDPFMGSGSTGKACMIENTERNADYKFIGIEMTEEYLPIADARIRYWVDREIEEEVKEDVEPVKKEDVVKLW